MEKKAYIDGSSMARLNFMIIRFVTAELFKEIDRYKNSLDFVGPSPIKVAF